MMTGGSPILGNHHIYILYHQEKTYGNSMGYKKNTRISWDKHGIFLGCKDQH
jgi:hypothetical protein